MAQGLGRDGLFNTLSSLIPSPPPCAGAFAQLTIALGGNAAAGTASAGSDLWICGETGFPALLRNLITSLGPSILLSIYNMVILPVIIYYLAQVGGWADWVGEGEGLDGIEGLGAVMGKEHGH